MRVIKSEWHSVEKRYDAVIDENIIAEVYPHMSDEEVTETYNQLVSGELAVDDFMLDAIDEGIDLDWEWLAEDDWYTDRKGGYEVTYELDEE